MSMSQTQIAEQVAYLQNRIERQQEIIGGLETEGYGGGVIRSSRMLLKQMIADLDGLLLQLRPAGPQANPAKATRQRIT
jgi:hypothetical protein